MQKKTIRKRDVQYGTGPLHLKSSVADPDPFDTDPDPAFYFDTDPDPTDTDLDLCHFKEVMYLKQYF